MKKDDLVFSLLAKAVKAEDLKTGCRFLNSAYKNSEEENESFTELIDVLYSLIAFRHNYFSDLQKIKGDVIYFLRNKQDRLIKIGCTKFLKQRICALEYQYKSKLELLFAYPCSKYRFDCEREFHDLFSRYNVYGEWFDIPYKVLKKIEYLICTEKDMSKIIKKIRQCLDNF